MKSWKRQKTELPPHKDTLDLAHRIQKACVRTSHGQAAFNAHLAAQIIEEHYLSRTLSQKQDE